MFGSRLRTLTVILVLNYGGGVSFFKHGILVLPQLYVSSSETVRFLQAVHSSDSDGEVTESAKSAVFKVSLCKNACRRLTKAPRSAGKVKQFEII